jgi:hypothetical protein
MDLFVVPTLSFDLLYAFIIVRLDRRDLIWINVTRHPTAEWIARQITEAFPWNEQYEWHCHIRQVQPISAPFWLGDDRSNALIFRLKWRLRNPGQLPALATRQSVH